LNIQYCQYNIYLSLSTVTVISESTLDICVCDARDQTTLKLVLRCGFMAVFVAENTAYSCHGCPVMGLSAERIHRQRLR